MKKNVEILAKLEFLNPGGSIKDRVANSIVAELEKRGDLKSKKKIVAITSGNLGTSLSIGLSNRNHESQLICIVPEKASSEKIQLLKSGGIDEIIRTLDMAHPASDESSKGVARNIVKNSVDPNSVLVIDEENKEWNLDTCYAEMANEIFNQCSGSLDSIFIPVQSGNAITLISKALKPKIPNLEVIGVEPVGSVFSGISCGTKVIPEKWFAEDYGNLYLPPTLDLSVVDKWIQVSDQNAYCMARELIKNGIHAGVSSGAVSYAAKNYYADNVDSKPHRSMIILCDSARFYTSTLMNDEYMLNSGLADFELNSRLYRKLVDQYRAASIEDLQLPAAVAIHESSPLSYALELMMERDFSQVPVTTANRKLVGFISKTHIENLLVSGEASPESPITDYMHKFVDTSVKGLGKSSYKLITPETPLVDLAKFFESHSVAFVTDTSRRFCLGVVTKNDLLQFIERRGFRNY
ncbi:hypothetical protein BB558_001625 [Smittium angustum]|uniref:CBS domain-containing protein n=1 Tax=Smittium angustum TaxID=133377 RepID=A0A2U1JB40_SMIAN|nr:hypothetical protein BB558_001625 [Smittium angustum]